MHGLNQRGISSLDVLPSVAFQRIVHVGGCVSFPVLVGAVEAWCGHDAAAVMAEPSRLLDSIDANDRAALCEAGADASLLDREIGLVTPEGVGKRVRVVARERVSETGDAIADGAMIEVTGGWQASHGLYESIQKLSLVFDRSTEFISVKELDGRYTYINKAFLEAFALPAEEILGRTSTELFGEEVGAPWEAHDRETIEGREVVTQQTETVHADGVLHSEIVTKFPIFDDDGNVIALGIVEADVTALKDAQYALSEREARFSALVENAPYAIFLKGLDGRYTVVNPKFCESTGLPANEILGRKSQELFETLDSEVSAELDDRVIDHRETISLERKFRYPNGRIEKLIETKFPILGPDGAVIAIGGIDTVITDLKRAEELLRRRETIFKQAYEISKVGYWTWDPHTNLLDISPEMAALLGLPEAELAGLTNREYFDRFVHADDREQARIETTSIPGRPSRFDLEYRLVPRDGEVRWIREVGDAILSETGEVIEEVGTIQDITEQKRQEEALVQAQKMEAVGQLTGGVAHDFNNLLAVIQGNLELLDDALDGQEENRTFTQRALSAAERGAVLTHRLLAFSRRQPLRPGPTDVNEVVADTTDLLHRTLGEAVELVTSPTPDLWLTLVDRGQLESALLNLAINSRDAMPGGGRLTIEAANVTLDDGFNDDDADAPPGDYIQLSIRDNGFGMAPWVLGRVFEPFFTTKEVGKGSGLGLSMVYGFAKQSGGHVRIESEVGRGTVARLYLPRANAAPAKASQASPARCHQKGMGETILVVEDDGAVRELVTGMLRGLGYETLEAVDAESGLAVLADSPGIDLLFSDVVLSSGPNGPEMAREARALRPSLRVLFMSGYVEGVEGIENPALDGAGLIQKPFRKAELAEALRTALE